MAKPDQPHKINKMEKAEITVEGMTCNGCVTTVKKVLTAIPGVQKVEVILENGQVTVHYEKTRCNWDQFKQAIEDAGFDVKK